MICSRPNFNEIHLQPSVNCPTCNFLPKIMTNVFGKECLYGACHKNLNTLAQNIFEQIGAQEKQTDSIMICSVNGIDSYEAVFIAEQIGRIFEIAITIRDTDHRRVSSIHPILGAKSAFDFHVFVPEDNPYFQATPIQKLP
jgi:hypothetical protein